MAKCRIGTAKFFTFLLLLYRTSVKKHGQNQYDGCPGKISPVINRGRGIGIRLNHSRFHGKHCHNTEFPHTALLQVHPSWYFAILIPDILLLRYSVIPVFCYSGIPLFCCCLDRPKPETFLYLNHHPIGIILLASSFFCKMHKTDFHN